MLYAGVVVKMALTSKVLCPVAVHLYNWSQGLVVKKTVTNEAWSWCVLLLYIYNWQQELVVERAVTNEVYSVCLLYTSDAADES